MGPRGLIALILCSSIVTLDGTAVTVALPDIGRGLRAPLSTLQWVSNVSLLMLAALLVPAGRIGDRFGRRRVMIAGLLVFSGASLMCALAQSPLWLIAWRMVQGVGASLIVPGAIAVLRATYRDEAERTRAFGIWAGWSGLAGALGPVLGGGVVDLWSWRAVFVMSAALAVPALILMPAVPESRADVCDRLSVSSTVLIIALLGSVSFGLIEAGHAGWSGGRVLGAFGAAAASMFLLARRGRMETIVPRELTTTPNCVAANAVTSALYFGLFGLSFLLVTYTQDELGYSALWAGVSVLPMALLMLLAEPFGRLATQVGSRRLITAGAIVAAGGVLWIAAGPHPVPFASHIVPGTVLFGFGLAMAVSPLTHAAVSSLPARTAGAASGVHHALIRAAGLVAIAALGSIAAGGASGPLEPEGFRDALLLCAAVVLVFGVAAALRIQDDEPGGLAEAS